MSHIIIIGKAKTCIDTLQKAINVASAGGAHIHAQLAGYQDVEAELNILNSLMPGCAGELTAQIAALEEMLPSTSE